MFSFLKNVKVKKDKKNKSFFYVANDVIFVDKTINEKMIDAVSISKGADQQQFVQQFEEDSSWFI